MFSGFSTFQSVLKYSNNKVQVATGALSSFSSVNSGILETNVAPYTATNFNVYAIKNNNALPTTTVNGTNSTGTFTLTISGGTATIYLLIIGSGGSGGSGGQGGGGASSGEFKIQTITLATGTYNCSFQVGAGPGGSAYVASNSTYGDGINGYGMKGSSTTITINGTTYTAVGGSPGGPTQYNNASNGVGAYGGGAGLNIANGASGLSGSTGSIAFKGGSAVATTNICGGSGGGSPMGNGSDGPTAVVSVSYNAINGALGAIPISSNHSSLSTTPFRLFNPVQYWCEGGHGACGFRSAGNGGLNVPGIISSYGLSGRGSGCSRDNGAGVSTNYATNPINHTGSGGGGCFQGFGLGQFTQYAPSGSNGLILIAF